MRVALIAVLASVLAACSSGGGGAAKNPFLEDQANLGKSDTQYMNPDGIEVEVDLESDVDAPSYQKDKAPAVLGQFALTYMRKRGEFYLESLAEDASSRERVEWLVDEKWMTAAEVKTAGVADEKLKHFRIRGVNAVLLHEAATGVTEGKVFKAKVPVKPFSVMDEAKDACADPDGHMHLDASIYWYMWNPERPECKVAIQDLTMTLSKIVPTQKVTYPEYDQLVADNKVTAVVLFGQIGDGEITESDWGMRGFKEMAGWLKQAKFDEVTPAPLGRRFTKAAGTVTYEIDLYSPKEFAGLGDWSHFPNLQKAVGAHEIVVYDGHSMLGASQFWANLKYPDFYQVFLYGGCLGYEYYILPILKGKGGDWSKLDLMSSVVEVSVGANEFAGPFLSKLLWALTHDYNVSWKDMLAAVRMRVGDSTFGASGIRENCFSPTGSLCGPVEPDPEKTKRYENAEKVQIPDESPTGVVSVIDVPDSIAAKSVTMELDVTHSFAGDLKITVEHDGVEVPVWDHSGASNPGIQQSFTLEQFAGKDVLGRWTLLIVDDAKDDVGTLVKWAIVVAKP